MTTTSLFKPWYPVWLQFSFLLSFLMFPLLSLAQNVSSVTGNNLASVPVGTYRTDIASIITCVILVIIGLAYCFYGFKLFFFTLFITGFAFGFIITTEILRNTGAFSSSSSTTQDILIAGISLGVGLIGGLMLVCFWNIGIYIIGALLGLSVAGWLVSLLHLGTVLKLVLYIVFIIIGLVLVHYFERPLIIIGTAWSGASLTITGVDWVVNAGLTSTASNQSTGISSALWGELAGFLALFILGTIHQFRSNEGEFGGQRRGKQQQPPYAPYQPAYGKA